MAATVKTKNKTRSAPAFEPAPTSSLRRGTAVRGQRDRGQASRCREGASEHAPPGVQGQQMAESCRGCNSSCTSIPTHSCCRCDISAWRRKGKASAAGIAAALRNNFWSGASRLSGGTYPQNSPQAGLG